jgi:PPK2 family polyphosphate:nucleotide phosphotransferase
VASAFVDAMRIEPGAAPRLKDRDPGVRPDGIKKQEGLARLAELTGRLEVLHDRLWAEATRAVLLVLQGVDASGKDGTIKHVLTGVNPQGVRIASFKAPSATELAHDYLWRVHAVCPQHGELGIFNRSHYEDVIAVRVRKLAPKHVWSKRYAHIREFERLLVDEGTHLVKICLHVSKEAQGTRLQERLDTPEKRWKFRLADLDDRKLWDDFTAAYEDAIRETSTEWAPWHVVPADHNWVRNVSVAEILVDAFERLDPQYPPPDPQLDGVKVT